MSDVTTDWPTCVDDDGTGRTGTRLNTAFFDTIKTAINNQVASSTNPTLTPEDIIDEVVEARGSQASLDDRWDEEHNEDGTHKAVVTSGVTTVSQFMGGIGATNLLGNDDFLVWPDGDAAAPDLWTLAGTGATIERCGTGLTDTNRKVGDFCAGVTRGTTDASLTQTLLSGNGFTRANFIVGLYAAAGAWVKTSTANAARIAIADGVGTSTSSYHTGGGSWEFLAVTRQIDVSANKLDVACQVNNSAVEAHFSGFNTMLIDSDQTMTRYMPSPVLYGVMHFALSGNLSTGLNQGRIVMARTGIVKDVQLYAKTAPVGAAAIFDINTWDSGGGGAFSSMFSTKPQIDDGDEYGAEQPDGTYARRCLRGMFGDTAAVGGVLTMDVDQVGSGTAGADAVVEVRVLQYQRVLERFLDYNA